MATLAYQPEQTRPTGRAPTWWWVAGAAATAVGVAFNLTAGRMAGSEPFAAEDVVDAVGGTVLGGLGVVLLHRRVAAGLGRALLAASVLLGAVWLTGGLADALAQGEPQPSWPARALDVLNGVLFIPSFVIVLLAPLLLFPDGRLPSRRWRPVGWVAVGGVVGSMLAALVASGPVDEDVPAWGANPFGIDGLDGVTSALEGAGLVALLVSVVAGVAAVVVRVVTARGGRRRQMWWFLGLAGPALVLVFIDTGGLLPGALTAVVVFALLLAGIGYPLLAPDRAAGQEAGPVAGPVAGPASSGTP